MKKIIDYIFREIPPISDINGQDHVSTVLNTNGDFWIFLFFLAAAIIAWFYAGVLTPKEAYNQRLMASKLLAGAFFFCAVSRGFNVLAVWHNFYFLNGVFKNVSAAFALALISYVPYLIKSIKNERELEKVKQTLKETSAKVDKLSDLSEKILQKGNRND